MEHASNLLDEIFDEEIRQLTELKRMAGNPRLLDLMRKIVEASDASKHNPVQVEHKSSPTLKEVPLHPVVAVASQPYKPNGLTAATLDVVQELEKSFSIPTVVARLKEKGFHFNAANPKVAVAGPIGSFAKRGVIRLVRPGSGSDPNLYDFVSVKVGQLDLDRAQ